MNNKQKVFTLAHRGYSAMYPENTKLAFLKALEVGFDGVETDVHLTKDQQLVIIHDENTIRTSELEAIIKETTLEELRAADFGCKFSEPTILGEKVSKQYFFPQTILTFEEFLEMFSDKFKIINIEVKTDIEKYEGIEEKVLEVLKNYREKTHFILSSFNNQTLINLRKLDQEIELGLLILNEKVYENLTDADFENFHNMYQYISIRDDLLLNDQSILDKFNLPYMIWGLRRGDQIQNYTKKDCDNYNYFANKKNVYMQIVNYKWD